MIRTIHKRSPVVHFSRCNVHHRQPAGLPLLSSNARVQRTHVTVSKERRVWPVCRVVRVTLFFKFCSNVHTDDHDDCSSVCKQVLQDELEMASFVKLLEVPGVSSFSSHCWNRRREAFGNSAHPSLSVSHDHSELQKAIHE